MGSGLVACILDGDGSLDHDRPLPADSSHPTLFMPHGSVACSGLRRRGKEPS